MSSFNTNHFSFKIKMIISDVTYQMEMCSDKVMEEGMKVEKQVIIFKDTERGVSMMRKKMNELQPRFTLVGHGDWRV